ncbi:MAG: aldo/keto reductase [Elusimicrobia bacterium]|nr:aldo/keto reductase [Elusimicrobiota bacterium]
MLFSAVGLGTWRLEADERAAAAALRRGIEEGANHIDTAEMYGNGGVERIVGKAIRGMRDRVFLVSKVLPCNASFANTLLACERSLKNLATDHIDVYLLHWRERAPLEETFRAFDKLLQDGKIRAFGVSNFDVKDLEEAIRIAGPGRIACNQVLYHLKERAAEFEVLPWCAAHGIPVVAYSPLGEGSLASDPALAGIAAASNAAPCQIALNFLIRCKGVFAIPKSSNIRHVIENIQAEALTLTERDIERIETAFPARRKTSLPML